MSLVEVFYWSVIISIVSISASTVKWLPNSSFKLPENYKDGKLPCSKQTVVFPELVIGSIEISETQVNQLILPQDGELILDDMLILGSNPLDTNCTDGNAYYLDKTSSAWNQAGVWSSPSFNDATPDSDRIPCFNDIVRFPQGARYTVILPKLTQHVKALYIGNDSYTTEDFRSHVLEESNEIRQQFVLNEYTGTGVKISSPMVCTLFGCPCQLLSMDIDCSVKFCPKPTCVAPIKPFGFCCEICGGHIVFDADEGFDMLTFKKLVEKYATDSVVYHIGFTPELPIKRIQLVMVDKGGYEGSSTEIINSISSAMDYRWYKGPKLAKISGSPLYKANLGGTIFISTFFAIVLTFAGFYVYYYRLPGLRIPVFSHGAARNVFTRFQTRSDSVVSLTRRDSVISTARGGTAFRNPMYDSRRGRVQVTENVAED